MKRLSDYTDEEAIDLWADLLDPITVIIKDPNLQDLRQKAPIEMAKEIIKLHKSEVTEILLRIDPTPITGLNLIVRVVDVIMEIEESSEIMSFFDSSEPSEQQKPFGSATANTQAKGK